MPTETQTIPGPDDPAKAAAGMLLRFGFAILAVVTPSATMLSRWVIVILVPIAAVLIILSALLRRDPARLLESCRHALLSWPGVTAMLLVIWALFSLSWTPLPGEAAARLFKTVGVILLGFMAVQALPTKMRATNLHLVTIGVALGALLLLAGRAMELADLASFQFPAATPGRATVLIACLGWAAAAWLIIKNRRLLAALLLVLVFAAAMSGPTGEAILPTGIGFLVFALAWAVPERAGRMLAVFFALLVGFAPLIPLLGKMVTLIPGITPGQALSTGALWWDIIQQDPVAALTGRGIEAIGKARSQGLVPAAVPSTLISDLWFDLGLLGALAMAFLVFLAFRAAGRFGLEVAPFALAGLASAFAFTFLERGATQTWWLNGMTVFSILLMSVERGRYRTVRPRAAINESAEAANIPMRPGNVTMHQAEAIS